MASSHSMEKCLFFLNSKFFSKMFSSGGHFTKMMFSDGEQWQNNYSLNQLGIKSHMN